MKRIFGTLLICGFLAASFAQASETATAPKVHRSKVAKKQARKVKKQNAKARKMARARKARVQKSA